MHDLDRVPVVHDVGLVFSARNDRAIDLHRHGPARELEVLEEPAHAESRRKLLRCPIQGDYHEEGAC